MVSRKRRPAEGQTVAPLSRRLLGSAGLGLLMACAAVTARAEPSTAPAAEIATDPTITGSLERHWTNNALDSDHAVKDWYTLLR
ncbi:hypothetical protein EN895_12220, partial [Mesorhizobium sp. M7A.F.Ca.CA.002.03.2.1]